MQGDSKNAEKKSFEVVATCSFQTGREVTFWYSDDCADVMILIMDSRIQLFL